MTTNALRDKRTHAEQLHATVLALLGLVDHGAGTPLTLDEATAAVQPLVTQQRRDDLPRLVAYLACQVVGYRRSQNADAKLAMAQVAAVVDRYRGLSR